jgi:5-methylcytosine-specific restriction endonuclease McrA
MDRGLLKYEKEGSGRRHRAAQRRFARRSFGFDPYKEVEGSHTVEAWLAVRESFGNRCLCCDRDDVALEKEHVVPLSMGGTNYIENIQPLCRRCNSSKWTNSIDYREKPPQDNPTVWSPAGSNFYVGETSKVPR